MDFKKKIEDIFDITAQPTVDIVSSMFLEGMVGSVVPGVTSAMLGYKQKRSEKMIEEFMIETRRRQQELEGKIIQLDEEKFTEIKEKYFGLTLDYVMETKQEEKIKYIVNGFINLTIIENLQEDVILIYYDILKKTGVSHDQYKLIQNKLERLGLIETKGQSQYDEMFENVKNIGEYLVKLEKNQKVKLKFKKPSGGSIKSYKLTKLGWGFLDFFIGDSAS